MATNFGVVRCCECGQDITKKTQVYDRPTGKIYCENCNWRVGKGIEVPQRKKNVV